MGGSFKPDVKLEASNRVSFIRGTVGMARAANPNSANSQFFIVTEDSTFLDGNYTLFGRVIEGMEYVDMIAPGEPPANPDKIVKMQVAADAE
jgi:peptidylprolyl isomerase